MTSYADKNYYLTNYSGKVIPQDQITEILKKASRHIDTLTYNRIVGRGFENLTKFQQGIIQEVVCRLADFEFENEDILKTVISTYSINGVSLNFGENWNIELQNGVAIPKDCYCLLAQTGLTCRNLRC